MTQSISSHLALAQKLTGLFAELPQVEAIALGGSLAGDAYDATSDIDLYVYTRAGIPLLDREGIVTRSGGASIANLGLDFWGLGDEWYDAVTGIEVDIIYFGTAWMHAQIQQVLVEHRASLGYTTCFWHTIRQSHSLYDPNGWYRALQVQCQQSYPEPLRQNIIRLNHPVLRSIIPAYFHQVEKAVRRQDLLSVNHRLAAFFASYFDILFAANRVPHPGEKRLAAKAVALCSRLPVDMTGDISAILRVSGEASPELLVHLTRLLDHLDEFLRQESCYPAG